MWNPVAVMQAVAPAGTRRLRRRAFFVKPGARRDEAYPVRHRSKCIEGRAKHLYEFPAARVGGRRSLHDGYFPTRGTMAFPDRQTCRLWAIRGSRAQTIAQFDWESYFEWLGAPLYPYN